MVTAKEAFETADLNHDGRLSFSEFKRWYSDGWMGNGSTPAENNATSNGGTQDIDEIEEQKELLKTHLICLMSVELPSYLPMMQTKYTKFSVKCLHLGAWMKKIR